MEDGHIKGLRFLPQVDNICALQFGHDATPNNGVHNQLFFTAVPDSYANGLFGVITVGP